MKKQLVIAFAIFSMVLVAKTSQAAIAFDFAGGINDVSFDNWEVVLRTNTSGTGTLLGGGYDLVDNTEVLAVGDILVQIYNGTALKIDGLAQPGAIGTLEEFTGYAVQRLALPPVVNSATDVDLTFGPALVDPFGVMSAAELAAGVSLKLFSDPSKDFTHQTGLVGRAPETAAHSAGLIADVVTATNGALFASFGFGPNTDAASVGLLGPAYFLSAIDPTELPAASNTGNPFGTAQVGLNVFVGPPGVAFLGHDVNGIANTSISGQAEFYVNRLPGAASNAQEYIGFDPNGDSNWIYASDDPLQFRATPEPATFLMWIGLSLVAGAAYVWRQKFSAKVS